MAEKCDILCPHCEAESTDDPYHRVFYHNGHPRCETCGAQYIAGEWILLCETCGKEADKLHAAPFVPTLCEDCLNAAKEADRASGRICPDCRQPRTVCSC